MTESTQTILEILASLATGLAVLASMTPVAELVFRQVDRSRITSEFERNRRGRLAETEWTYRTFESLIERLVARDVAVTSQEELEKLSADLEAAGLTSPWTASEYRAAKLVDSLVIGLAVFVIVSLLSGNPVIGLIASAPIAIAYYRMGLANVGSLIKTREQSIHRSLPYVIDLMSLMVEAGASFPEALATVSREFAGTPLGDELGRVLRDIEMGRPRGEALSNLPKRIRSEDLSELVFSIVKGEELGTPLSQLLRSQATELRIKRSQRIEKAAAEAQVKIGMPGFVVMIACMLVIVAPFLLQGAFEFFRD